LQCKFCIRAATPLGGGAGEEEEEERKERKRKSKIRENDAHPFLFNSVLSFPNQTLVGLKFCFRAARPPGSNVLEYHRSAHYVYNDGDSSAESKRGRFV